MLDPIYPNRTYIELIADYTLALPLLKINYSVNKFASIISVASIDELIISKEVIQFVSQMIAI